MFIYKKTHATTSQPAVRLICIVFVLVSIKSGVQLVLMHYVTLYGVA